MSISTYLNAMRDPAGLPTPAFVFDIFLVVTFALHILLVNLALGSLGIILWGKVKNTEFSLKLSSSLSRLLVNSISWLIVLGVAPLLFIQVIYDPFWYTANTLSAKWALYFLIFIALGFVLTYIYYLRGGYESKGNLFWLIISGIFFLLAAYVMHSLAVAQLYPEKWPTFSVKNGIYISSGKYLHGFELFRFLHFIIPSLAVIGVWLLFYAKYFKGKYEEDYLKWVERLGLHLALIFSLIQGVVGFLWLITLPSDLNFVSNPVFIIALVIALLFIGYLFYSVKSTSPNSTLIGILLGITVLAMSAAREALRMSFFSKAGYTFADYPVNLSMGSLILFLLTFIMGLIVLLYVAIVAYRSGKGLREVGAHALGKASVFLLWFWILIMVIIGIYISIKNGVLF
ncbi:MAG: hypothetical protein ACK4Y7_03020 [Caldimicrobium sp.]